VSVLQVQGDGCSYSVYTSLSLKPHHFLGQYKLPWISNLLPHVFYLHLFTKPQFSFAGCELRTHWQSSDFTVSCEVVRSDGSDAGEDVAPCDRPPECRLTHHGCLHQTSIVETAVQQAFLTASCVAKARSIGSQFFLNSAVSYRFHMKPHRLSSVCRFQ
jgi:hypothetical protein